MKININALESLKSSINNFKSWNGINAIDWGNYFYDKNLNKSLDSKLTRTELLDQKFLDSLTNEELAIAILSWGGMNREHGKSLFNHTEWLDIITKMRKNEIKSRKEAYGLFARLRKNKKLKGMGPAYFSKLICFVNPNLKGYIMDQWTSKSVNLLFESKFTFFNKNGNVTDKNTPEIYEDFCCKIEYLADLLKLNPIDLEENLFSNGGVNKGKWREFVVDNWNNNGKIKLTKERHKSFFTDMEVIPFETALQKLDGNKIEILTLGGKSKVKVEVENNLIYITNSKYNKIGIDKTHWDKVMLRLNELPLDERGMTSRYGVGKNSFNWKECPNKIFSIYIPAVVKYLCN